MFFCMLTILTDDIMGCKTLSSVWNKSQFGKLYFCLVYSIKRNGSTVNSKKYNELNISLLIIIHRVGQKERMMMGNCFWVEPGQAAADRVS